MKTLKMVTNLMVLTIFVVFTAKSYGIELDVPFKAQYPPGEWALTKNCGPTSVLMVAAYHLGFTPAEQHIKDLDHWMVVESIISSINGYNAETTGGEDLVQIVQDYYSFQQAMKSNPSNIDPLRQALADGNPVIDRK